MILSPHVNQLEQNINNILNKIQLSITNKSATNWCYNRIINSTDNPPSVDDCIVVSPEKRRRSSNITPIYTKRPNKKRQNRHYSSPITNNKPLSSPPSIILPIPKNVKQYSPKVCIFLLETRENKVLTITKIIEGGYMYVAIATVYWIQLKWQQIGLIIDTWRKSEQP